MGGKGRIVSETPVASPGRSVVVKPDGEIAFEVRLDPAGAGTVVRWFVNDEPKAEGLSFRYRAKKAGARDLVMVKVGEESSMDTLRLWYVDVR